MSGRAAAHRAWVAGATGYTGQAVVGELRAHGIDTIAHVRPDSRELTQWTERFAVHGAAVSSCAWSQDALNEAMASARPTLVFALLGTGSARQGAVGRTTRRQCRDLRGGRLRADAAAARRCAAARPSTPLYLPLVGWGAEPWSGRLSARPPPARVGAARERHRSAHCPTRGHHRPRSRRGSACRAHQRCADRRRPGRAGDDRPGRRTGALRQHGRLDPRARAGALRIGRGRFACCGRCNRAASALRRGRSASADERTFACTRSED